jgi:hypothetical protein
MLRCSRYASLHPLGANIRDEFSLFYFVAT